MEPQTVQTVTQASDNLIPIVAAFFLAFTCLVKTMTEVYKIKRDRLKTKAERDKRFEALENKATKDDSE